MFILRPLGRPAIARLWSGLALSAVGDELYRVALIWIGVQLVGTAASYLSAVQAGASLVVGLFGGIMVDRWDGRRTLIGTDLTRSLAVLLPIAALLVTGEVGLPVLLATAVVVAGLRGLFDPILQAALARLVTDRSLLYATNGLFDGTKRLARLAGPLLVGLLASVVPIVYFFVVNAATFLLSALALWSLGRDLPPRPAASRPAPTGPRAARVLRSLTIGFELLRQQPVMGFVVWTNGVMNGAWVIAISLGTALVVDAYQPSAFGVSGVGAYAAVMASYGITNVAANLVIGSVPIRRPVRMMFASGLVLGGGIVFQGLAVWLAPADLLLPALMLGAALGAIGGPMSDIPMALGFQTGFRVDDIAAVYRLRMSVQWAFILVATMAAPLLFDGLGLAATIIVSGLAIAGGGTAGLLRFPDVAAIPAPAET